MVQPGYDAEPTTSGTQCDSPNTAGMSQTITLDSNNNICKTHRANQSNVKNKMPLRYKLTKDRLPDAKKDFEKIYIITESQLQEIIKPLRCPKCSSSLSRQSNVEIKTTNKHLDTTYDLVCKGCSSNLAHAKFCRLFRVRFAAQVAIINSNVGFVKGNLMTNLFGTNEEIYNILNNKDNGRIRMYKTKTKKTKKVKTDTVESNAYESGVF